MVPTKNVYRISRTHSNWMTTHQHKRTRILRQKQQQNDNRKKLWKKNNKQQRREKIGKKALFRNLKKIERKKENVELLFPNRKHFELFMDLNWDGRCQKNPWTNTNCCTKLFAVSIFNNNFSFRRLLFSLYFRSVFLNRPKKSASRIAVITSLEDPSQLKNKSYRNELNQTESNA